MIFSNKNFSVKIWPNDKKFPEVLTVENQTTSEKHLYFPKIYCTKIVKTYDSEKSIGHCVCSNCNKTIHQNSKFCSNCSAEVKEK